MKLAYMYTRVSTMMQADNYSIEAQKSMIKGHAKLHNIKIVGDYSDVGYSGKNTKRPEFSRMMGDIENHKDKIDQVLVFKLSRFARNAADTYKWVQFLEDYGVGLTCVEDGLSSTNANGKILISILSALAELERDNIHAQTMSGRREKAQKGEWNGGFAPYGYSLEQGKLVVCDDEAEVVRAVFKIYTETEIGFNGVAKRINEQYKKIPRHNGYLTRFSANQIRAIITNPVYKGVVAFGRRVTEKIDGTRNEFHIVKQRDPSKIIYAEGIHEAIVSKDVWDAANKKVIENRGTKEKLDKEHEYILSGLLRCPSCGSPMYGVPNGSIKYNKQGQPYRTTYSYKCRNVSRETGHVCPGKVQYSATKIDSAVRDIIIDMVNQENFGNMLLQLSDIHVDADAIKAQIESIDKEIRRLTIARTKANNELLSLDYSDPIADQLYDSINQRLKDTMTAIKEAEDRKEILNNRLLEIGNNEAIRANVYGFLSHFAELYDELTDSEKKATMKSFISSIELYPKKANARGGQWIKAINFKFPICYHGKVTKDIELDENGHISRPIQSTDECVTLITHK